MVTLRRSCGALAFALAQVLVACGSGGDDGVESAPSEATTDRRAVASGVFVVFGDGIDARVRTRYAELLGAALGKPAVVTTAEQLPATLEPTSLVLSVGATSLTRGL